MPPTPKQKIAVLGGGMAALTAVFELTSLPDHRDRYDITVYQMGWRLGGKGASGRNAAHADRIEEHGLHVLMGFYHNTFSVLRRCYDELARPPGTPLSTLDEAVKPQDLIVLADPVEQSWEPWPLHFPRMPGKPGVGEPASRRPSDYLACIVAWAHQLFTSTPELKNLVPDLDETEADVDALLGAPPARSPSTYTGPLRGDAHPPGSASQPPSRLDPTTLDPNRLATLIDSLEDPRRGRGPIAASAYLYLSKLASQVHLGNPGARIVWLLQRFRSWLGDLLLRRIDTSPRLRRVWTLLELGLTTVLGAFADGVDRAEDGWFSLDDHDLRAWLARHGASPLSCNSTLVRALYNLAFTTPGRGAAGALIHAAIRLVFDYQESVFLKMQAGMGDVVFAPLYLVLQRRGVKFEFFHRVDALSLSSDGQRIAAIEMGRQVRLQTGAYDPLRDVGGLPCWPSEPRYEQLDGGEALAASGQNLESWWGSWPDAERRRLELGRDFDRVILGISIGAFPSICKELIAASEKFAAMVAHVETTQTQAVQLWFEGSLGTLGWELGSPVLDAFAAPFDTWADMSHLLPHERWCANGAGQVPGSLAYLCSSLADDEPLPPRADEAYPERQAARVRANAVTWLEESARHLWPGTTNGEGGFAWSGLVDGEGRRGSARLSGQYWQATHCPSERFVLAVPGSTKHRLRADASGFANLVLAGDWVRTGMNVGCLEGATMGGMAAARAISGRPVRIPGDEQRFPEVGSAP